LLWLEYASLVHCRRTIDPLTPDSAEPNLLSVNSDDSGGMELCAHAVLGDICTCSLAGRSGSLYAFVRIETPTGQSSHRCRRLACTNQGLGVWRSGRLPLRDRSPGRIGRKTIAHQSRPPIAFEPGQPYISVCQGLLQFRSMGMDDQVLPALQKESLATQESELVVWRNAGLHTCNSQPPRMKEQAVNHCFRCTGNSTCLEYASQAARSAVVHEPSDQSAAPRTHSPLLQRAVLLFATSLIKLPLKSLQVIIGADRTISPGASKCVQQIASGQFRVDVAVRHAGPQSAQEQTS
jgi:hypothetical protein